MTFTLTFVLIFLIAFILIAGVVMYLSRTIEHGEARFGPDGKVLKDEPKPMTKPAVHEGPAKPATRIEENKK